MKTSTAARASGTPSVPGPRSPEPAHLIPGGRVTAVATADRAWVGARTAMAVGPLEVPTLEDLHRAVAQLAREVPAAHIGYRLDLERARWVLVHAEPAEAARAAVVVLDGAPDLGDEELLRRAWQVGDPTSAVLWVVAGDRVVVLLQHAAGDAGLLMPLLAGVVETARTGRVSDHLRASATSWPLVRSLWHHHRRDLPGLVERGLRATGLVRTVSQTGPGAPAHTAPVPAPRPAAGALPRPSGAGQPWQPQLDVVTTVLDTAAVRGVRRWARESAGVSSATALQVWLTRAALDAAGLPPQGRPTVLVDVRRNAAPGVVVPTNFVAPLELRVDDAWSGPSVAAALDEALEQATPLTVVAVGLLRSRASDLLRRGRRSAAAHLVPDQPQPRVTVSSLSTTLFNGVLAGPADQRRLVGMTSVGHPEAITATWFFDGRCMHVCLAFDSAVLPRERVEAAAALLVADPGALLTGLVARP